MEETTEKKTRKPRSRERGPGKKGTHRTSFAVSCQPEELERLKKIVAKSGKTTSRFLLDLAFATETEK